ncbi:MAG: hypothetical protein GXP40_03955 [Chloroflexi bacterium]|nr:hypothetical protein [Chloroflexota bacterium]
MQFRKLHFLIPILLGILLVSSLLIFWPTQHANAQCGSQASSCKNCHEVQAEAPVNNDGTSWHQAHAFGDFCYICHAGNSQATDKDEAHTGMVPPLSDVKASCQQCHPTDLMDRAEVYASALGVEIGAGGNSASTTAAAPSADGTANSDTNATEVVAAPSTTELVVDDPNVIDYEQRYEEIALGKRPTNWGDVILIVLIGLVGIGGGGYVLYNEKWISITTEPIETVPDGYPKEIVELLPELKELDKKGRAGLKKLLKDPEAANELLDVIARHTK